MALFVVVSLLTRWLSLVVDVIDIDETAYVVGAWEVLRGRMLFLDFVDNKPPLLYVYFLLTQVLLGRGLLSVHVVTAVVTVPLTAVGVSAFFRHDRTGLAAGLIFLVYSAAFIGHDMLASNAELPMMAIGVWALVALRDAGRARRLRPAAGAGLLLGVAFLVKYQIAVWLGALVFAIVCAGVERRRWRPVALSLVAIGLGFAAPLATTWSTFGLLGAQRDLVYWTITNNLTYAANPISTREAVERGTSYLLPFLIVTGPLWYGTWKGRALWGGTFQPRLLFAVLVSTFAAAGLGLRFFPHYFIQFYVPLAIGAGPWCIATLQDLHARRARLLLAWSAIMLGGFMVANAALYLGRSTVYRERDPVFRRVGERLRADACTATGSMFVWGYAPMFYYYADLPAASRFVVLAPARLTPYVPGNLGSLRDEASGARVSTTHWDWLMSDLAARKVTYVIDTAPAGIYRWHLYPLQDFPRIMAMVRNNFELIDVIDLVRIYRRRGCHATGPTSR